jgi:hypothetical protein
MCETRLSEGKRQGETGRCRVSGASRALRAGGNPERGRGRPSVGRAGQPAARGVHAMDPHPDEPFVGSCRWRRPRRRSGTGNAVFAMWKRRMRSEKSAAPRRQRPDVTDAGRDAPAPPAGSRSGAPCDRGRGAVTHHGGGARRMREGGLPAGVDRRRPRSRATAARVEATHPLNQQFVAERPHPVWMAAIPDCGTAEGGLF